METTQVAHPWRPMIRTAVDAAVALFPTLNGILAACMDWLTKYTPVVPDWLYLALNGTLLAAIALTAFVSRILALPGVVEWTRKHLAFLSPDGNPPVTSSCD